jgi:hypothetical protein
MIASLKASGRRASTLVARCACQIGSWPWRSSKVETVRYYCVGRYYGVAIRLNGSLLTNKEIVWEELVNFRQPRGRRYGPPARYRARPARACQFGRQLGGVLGIGRTNTYSAACRVSGYSIPSLSTYSMRLKCDMVPSPLNPVSISPSFSSSTTAASGNPFHLAPISVQLFLQPLQILHDIRPTPCSPIFIGSQTRARHIPAPFRSRIRTRPPYVHAASTRGH